MRLVAPLMLTAALIAAAGAARAQQMGTQPYAPRGGGTGIFGMGPSLAARQAILAAKIDGSRPSAMLRAGDGSLLLVTRRDGQAFVRQPASPFVLAVASDAYFGSAGYGGPEPRYGYSTLAWAGQRGSYSPAAASLDAWIAQLEVDAPEDGAS